MTAAAAAAAAAARARDIGAEGAGFAEEDRKTRARKELAEENKERGRMREDAWAGRRLRIEKERRVRAGRNMGSR